MGRTKLYSREEKLTQATRIFWKRGYYNVTLNELIKELGMGKRSFYEEFGSKDQLYHEALKNYAGIGRDTISEFFKTGKNLDNLIAGIKAILDITTYDAEVHSCMMSNTAIELANTDKKYRNLVSFHMNAMGSEFASILEESRNNGEIHEDLDTNLLGILTNIVFSGTGIAARGGVDIDDIKSSIDLFFELIRV